MARTTEQAVEGIIKTKSTDDLTPFIEAANAIVTKHCTDADFTTADLELIERWLSAHCYAIYKPRNLQERADIASRVIESKVGLGFDVTRYGQMAMRLDWSGALSALNEQSKKGVTVTPTVTWTGMTDDDLAAYLRNNT